MQYRCCFFVMAVPTILLSTAMWAAGADAEAILEASGLRKLSTSFALPEEAELSKQVRDADSLKRELFDTQKKVEELKKQVEDKRKLMIGYLEKRRELRAQLAAAKSVEAHNRIVLTLNELGDRVVLLHESKQEEDSLKAAMSDLGRLTEQYIEHLLKMRQFYDQVAGKYKQLSADPAIKQAIEQYNAKNERKFSLGPSASFLSNGRRLVKLEESVLSDSIALRRGAGDLWNLNVTFNGKQSTEMAIDTGASIIALPWRTAEQVGLKPSDDNEAIQLQMADGRVVEGKLVIAEKVRVGRFTAENVECAVMPAEMGEASPLLGLSFLKNFTFKIDSAAGKLILAKVDDPEAAGRSRGSRR
ncbi:MAG: TIGR02281 family clan AA aspartic protease [Pirellulales bacterium]|nr:TIGR02281 family clan AA aspartic protease [Pirellulales bacterium]